MAANVKDTHGGTAGQATSPDFFGFPNSNQVALHIILSTASISLSFFHLIDSLSIFRPHLKNTLMHKHTQTAPHSCFNLKYKLCIFNRGKCMCEIFILANNIYCGDTSLRPGTCRCTYLSKFIVLFN